MILLKTALDNEDATHEVLRKAAEEFVRAGVTITPSDWLLADPMERRAILDARKREEIERLLRMVTAFRNPSELVTMLAEVLDPETRDRLLAVQAAATASANLAEGKPL